MAPPLPSQKLTSQKLPSHQPPTASAYTAGSGAATVSSGDRLSFTAFLALAVHGLLIFGLTFNQQEEQESAPSVVVTLATHTNTQTPEDADFIAQANQLGSGTIEEAREITTDVISPLESTSINETIIDKQRRLVVEEAEDHRIITADTQQGDTNKPEKPAEKEGQDGDEDPLDLDTLNAQIASLKAKLAQQRQAYAKIPRERALTSVSTLASEEAAYLNEWTEKIERLGNQLFPQEAIRQKITGRLRLEVVIKQNGTIAEVNLKQSSGHKIFDQAARQIVHRASPFAPFPTEIRQKYDHLVIIRTWHFDINGLTTAQ